MSKKEENSDISTAGSWAPATAFNQMPALPKSEELESKPVLKKCIEARAALAELKQATALLPNPAMLINTIPMLEAQASSEIENVVTTADRLFRQMHPGFASDRATREAFRYRQALMEGFHELESRPLTTRTAVSICSRVKGQEMQIRRVPGVTIANAATGEAVYTPPDDPTLLASLLTDWEQFLHNRTDLDPLIRMAAAHFQFEAIHPFLDGNGRTGRILNILFLVDQGLLPIPVLYLSRSIIASKSDYYRLLLGVTSRKEWEPWLVFMLNCVMETAAWTTEKIAAIRELEERTAAEIRKSLRKIYSRELIEVIFHQPYCRIANLVEADIVGRQTASRYLLSLVEAGFLEERKIGRDKLFLNKPLLNLLTSP